MEFRRCALSGINFSVALSSHIPFTSVLELSVMDVALALFPATSLTGQKETEAQNNERATATDEENPGL